MSHTDIVSSALQRPMQSATKYVRSCTNVR